MRRALCALTAIIASALVAAPASWADPEGTPRCSQGWTFVDIKLKPAKQVARENFRAVNKSKKKITATFTTSKSKTVSWSASADIGGGIDAIIVSVKAEGSVSVAESSSTEVGLTTAVPVPPRSAVVASFGVFLLPVKGTLQRGNKYGRCLYRQRVKVLLPAGTGWLVDDAPL